MTSIALDRLARGPVDADFWPAFAQIAAAWIAEHGLHARDAIVLLPQAGLLADARAAFARQGGWQPRIDTARSLAAAHRAPPTDGHGPSGDPSVDRLAAALLLRDQPQGRAWAERDPRTFDASVAWVTDTAVQLQRAAGAKPPDERESWWDALRAELPPLAGPGGGERWLARIALEWAAASPSAATDLLWSLRPMAWVGLRALGGESLMEGLLAQAQSQGTPVLWLDADPPREHPFEAAAYLPAPDCAHAEDLEQEAGAAAQCVLDALGRGEAPVALIAQDRLVVRRIRALLERAGVGLADETGWALSTTRAAAHVMALLRAAQPEAGRDAIVEALKAEAPQAAAALEDAWRRERSPAAWALDAERALRDRLMLLGGSGPRRLRESLELLQRSAPALMAALAADAAGRQLLSVLRLDASITDPAWQSVAHATHMSFEAFVAWVDTTLEAATYVPMPDAHAQVIVTPAARAALRRFGSVVFPGCDDRHLGDQGVAGPSTSLIPEALARRFGLRDAAWRRERERLAFAQLLRVPKLQLLRRMHDGDEPLAPSPLAELAWHARRRAAQPLPDDRPVIAPRVQVERRPVHRPAPAMASSLPPRLSASAVEALRDCPYRFFARSALGLRESNELDAALDKSDYGRWLHAVLHRFHSQRREDLDDRVQLLAVADDVQAEFALPATALWPFRVGFDHVAERYLAWLHERDQKGWQFAAGELERRCAPPELGGLTLEGRLDRIDHGPDGGAMLIDYKTGNAQKLQQRVRSPLEDTQLAFYAALLTDEPQEPLPRAIYLALDEREAPREIEHLDVARSAGLLVAGLADDLEALRGGAGAPALGEGEACEHCHARGLCRRDHWSAA